MYYSRCNLSLSNLVSIGIVKVEFISYMYILLKDEQVWGVDARLKTTLFYRLSPNICSLFCVFLSLNDVI